MEVTLTVSLGDVFSYPGWRTEGLYESSSGCNISIFIIALKAVMLFYTNFR